mgnify:CR=1 FL=1
MIKKVYIFEYNDCIYESDYGVVSVHATRAGAQKALEDHKQACKEEEEAIKRRNPNCTLEFGVDEDWRVREMKIQQ